ncbi:PCRF domain-containing protein [Patescibacteria group bacterium]|nr:PCRF domain-containing protein [Patescibacteria group bacterium]
MDIPDYLKPQIEEIDKKIAEAEKLKADPSMAQLAQEEINKLEEEKSYLISPVSAEPETPGVDKYDRRNIILEIRGAAGGEEAKLWGQDLLRMYSRYAQTQGWKVFPEGDLSIKITGKGVYGRLKYESGVHRVQRVPVTESSGRVHTSTATVAVMPELEDIDVNINPADLEWDFFRGGGHGGQNVNKVSSAVRLTHKPTGTVVTCTEERDQSKNREKAEKKLRQILWEREEEKQLSEMTAERRAQVGTGMRNEKIRTYNFLQDRVTDHRLDQNFHNINVIMDGKLDEIINELQKKFTEKLPSASL